MCSQLAYMSRLYLARHGLHSWASGLQDIAKVPRMRRLGQ